MKRKDFLLSAAAGSLGLGLTNSALAAETSGEAAVGSSGDPAAGPGSQRGRRARNPNRKILIAGGGFGTTLNQQAIWRAQGIDEVLREAWDRGIVLGGSSAGSLCWFEEGTTDSRPKELSKIECLGFLEGSHSPHYDAEGQRRPIYQGLIGSGELKPGYACDNDAGIFFRDNQVARVVHTRPGANVYYVSVVNGRVVEERLEAEMIG